MKKGCSFLDERRQRNKAGLGAEHADSGSAEVLKFSWLGFGFFLTFLVKFFL